VQTSESGGNGVLAAPGGSTVTVQYTDLAPTPVVIINATRRVAIGGDLGVTFPAPSRTPSPCIIVPGTQLCNTITYSAFTIVVVDADIPSGGTPLVTVFNTRGLEAEVVTMRPNAVGSITFTGTLPAQSSTQEGTSGDGILNIGQGDRLQVRVLARSLWFCCCLQ
jgi:hypothetical protein